MISDTEILKKLEHSIKFIRHIHTQVKFLRENFVGFTLSEDNLSIDCIGPCSGEIIASIGITVKGEFILSTYETVPGNFLNPPDEIEHEYPETVSKDLTKFLSLAAAKLTELQTKNEIMNCVTSPQFLRIKK